MGLNKQHRARLSTDTAAGPIGRRIREIREHSGLSQAELAAKIDRTQTALSYWETGRRTPSLADLLDLAVALDRPVADLLPASEPRTPVKAHLRAAIDKLDHSQLSESIQAFLHRAEKLAAGEPTMSVWEDNPIRAAHQALSKAAVTKAPVEIESVAQAAGVRVLPWKFDNALSGLVVELEDGAVIGVNSRHPPVRQRFTVAHELGHFFLRHSDRFHIDLQAAPGDGEPPGYHPRHEREANDFAANVLMPAALVRAEFARNRSIDYLSSAFCVSDMAMRYRLVNLGIR